MTEESPDFIINFLEKIPRNYCEYYLETRLISGFSSNFLDEIQDLLKQIAFLENSIDEIRVFLLKQNFERNAIKTQISNLKLENEELRENLKNSDILNKEYKEIIAKEAENRGFLCGKLAEKETEIAEFIDIIEVFNKKIINYEQMRKLMNNHINQLEETVVKDENNQKPLEKSVFSRILKKISYDYDVLSCEKDEIYRNLKLKSDEFTNLQGKYLKTLKKNKALYRKNQELEVEILENNQEFLLLKEKIRFLKNKLIKNAGFPKENVNFPPFLSRKAKSFTVKTEENSFEKSPKYNYFTKKTLFEELSSKNQSFHLDLLRKEDLSLSINSQKGHKHQESFGLQIKNVEEFFESISNLKEESPKFANNNKNSSFSIKSDSTIEADFITKNPFPNKSDENASISSNSAKNLGFHTNINKNCDNSEEMRKKLLEIDKKCVFFKGNEEKYDKWHKMMKISLRMIPSGMFFSKILDFSEKFLKK